MYNTNTLVEDFIVEVKNLFARIDWSEFLMTNPGRYTLVWRHNPHKGTLGMRKCAVTHGVQTVLNWMDANKANAIIPLVPDVPTEVCLFYQPDIYADYEQIAFDELYAHIIPAQEAKPNYHPAFNTAGFNTYLWNKSAGTAPHLSKNLTWRRASELFTGIAKEEIAIGYSLHFRKFEEKAFDLTWVLKTPMGEVYTRTAKIQTPDKNHATVAGFYPLTDLLRESVLGNGIQYGSYDVSLFADGHPVGITGLTITAM